MSEFLERIAKLPPKRLALLAADLQARLERAEGSRREPIAVIGLGCRFPGARGPAAFWQILRDGIDAISPVPPERWDSDAYFDPDPDTPGRMNTRWGGFLDDVDRFDAQLFGITPREAQSMDPQQRILLEVAWEALENAGQAPDRLNGSRTGVFVGICNGDYYQMVIKGKPEAHDLYVATGASHSVAAGRIAYLLGLTGPNLAVDTACSSSLVAVHLACQSLRAEECRMALAGGVNLILIPDITLLLSRAHMMASDGRCKFGDARADGFVRGEGCGLVVLKRLADAVADGDRVLAVIHGSAINQDGRSNGLTAPNGPAQEAVIREALAQAGVHPEEVGYVEAHGTGTVLGDPIELQALGAVLGSTRSADDPLLVGSVKTNLGHLESAAGIAGLIKVVLALEHGEVPPSLHFLAPNPHIPWDRLSVAIPTRRTPWVPNGGRRLAGVSSFGFSGTNAHVVLGEAPRTSWTPPDRERPCDLLVLSARHEEALREAAGRLAEHLARHPELSLGDVCFTANSGRAQLAHRVAVPGTSLDEVRERLTAVAGGQVCAGVATGRAGSSPPEPVFLFTGQGSQRVGMGRELYETQPVFRQALERCQAILQGRLDWPLLSLLYPEDSLASPLDQTAYAQPALFALEYALAELWRSWGVEPVAVLGHSVGEYVATCVAGMLSLEEGLTLVAERGRLMQGLPRDGAMAAIFATESAVTAAINGREADVAIAAVNGPAHTVISGRSTVVAAVLDEFGARGIRGQRLNVSHAFHSPLMDPVLPALEQLTTEVAFAPPRIGIVSNVTGAFATGAEIGTGTYWRRHTREPVRFAEGVRRLQAAGHTVFVEIGPTPTLLGMVARCLPEGAAALLPSMRPGRGDWETLLGSVAELWVRGVPIDWAGVNRGYSRRRLALPTYPFQRERHWVEPTVGSRARHPTSGAVAADRRVHPLLGARVRSPLSAAQFESELGVSSVSFLRHHHVQGRIVMPSPAYVEMALAAAAEIFEVPPSAVVLEHLAIESPLVLAEDGSRIVQLVLAPAEGAEPAGGGAVEISSLEDPTAEPARWRRHATARVRLAPVQPAADQVRLVDLRDRCTEEMLGKDYYQELRARGLEFGESFRGITRLWRGRSEALGQVEWPNGLKPDARYGIHPALLDACWQVLGAAWPEEGGADTWLLVGLDRFRLVETTEGPLWSHARLRPSPPGAATVVGDVQITDASGRLVALVEGLHLRRLPSGALPGWPGGAPEGWFYDVQWPAHPRAAQAASADGILGPRSIAERVASGVPDLAAQNGLDAYGVFLPGLESLSAGYVHRAFDALGWVPQLGERISAGALAHRLGVVGGHRRLFDRMLEILAEDGVLRSVGPTWEVVAPLSIDGELDADALARLHPIGVPAVDLTARCGERLADVLRGIENPLDLLFPAGSFAAVEALYEGSPAAQVFNALVGRSIGAAVAGMASRRRLRILELGGGTGGTTASVLSALPTDRTEYVFTDLSPLFTARASERFAEHRFMSYRTLDIERDPAAQGFAGERFDIVLAANVLHATRDLRQTLAHVRQLLAPEGLLVLLEGTGRWRWVDLTFGLTEGWWRFDDGLRAGHPLLPADQWLELLGRQGFVEAVSVPRDVAPQDVLASQTVILARADRAKAEGPSKDPGAWLVLADRSGAGEALVAALRSRGQRVVVAMSGERCETTGVDRWIVDPRRGGDLRRVLREGRPDGTPWRGVVHLWSLDAPGFDGPDAGEAAEVLGCRSTLDLVRMLVTGEAGAAARLWLITRGAQPVPGSGQRLAIEQAPLWGLGRTIALEHPDQWGALIDIDSSSDIASLVATELLDPDGEDQVALRDGVRHVARLVRRPPPAAVSARFSPDATYLVTGGLGGLGLTVARWMAERGARHLVLVGRRGLPDREVWSSLPAGSELASQAAAVEAIEALGARVRVAAVDIADRAAVGSLLRDLAATWPSLRGVIHAAAALRADAVSETSGDALADVLRPKVRGTAVLHELTRELPLDFFALFSSTTSLLGAGGLGHYAAANQFLDAFAHHRRSLGLPAVSVNWGTWDEMRAASAGDRRRVATGGLKPMASARALEVLGYLLEGGSPQVAVAEVDWTALRPLYEARRRRPFLEQVGAEVPTRAEAKAIPPSSFRREIEAAPADERYQVLVDLVSREVAHVLRLGPAQPIDIEQGLFDMGMDSLMSLDLRRRLETSVGLALPSTVAFNYPTIAALAGYLVAALAGPPAETAVPGPAAAAAETATDESDELSEDELAERLARKLAGRR